MIFDIFAQRTCQIGWIHTDRKNAQI